MRALSLIALALAAASSVAADNPVQALIDAAMADGRAQVTLPGGELRLDSGVLVDGAQDLVIDGGGSTLVFTNWRDGSIELRACARVTLRDLTIDCDPLPFTQGTIVALSEDRSVWEFEVHDGYPTLTEDYLARQCYVYEPDRPRLRWGVPDIYPRSVEALGERRGRITVSPQTPMLERVEVGDRIVLTIRGTAGVHLNTCADVTLQDLTVRTCPGIAILGRYLIGNNVFRRLTIEPGPPPAGATQPRLMSACAYGLNVAYATRGPTIEDCRFRAQGDDSVNLHGPTLAVCAVEEGAVVLGWPYGGAPFERMVEPGAIVRGLRPGSFEIAGEAEIASIERVREVPEAWREVVQAMWPRRELGTGRFFRVALDAPLPVAVGQCADIPALACPGFVIRGCTFADHRARGLRIMAAGGLIEGNTIERVQQAAITIGAEYGFWRDAGWVSGVTVRGNTIRDVGRGANLWSPTSYTLGAISVFGQPDDGFACAAGNRGIAIEGNTIDGCALAGIFVSCAHDVTIRGNTVAHTNYVRAPDAGSRYGLTVSVPIDACRSENVTVAGNRIEHPNEAPPDG